MGEWVSEYCYFIYYLHFYIYKLSFFLIIFFGLPKLLSDLTSQKDHFMVNKKTINQVGHV